MHIKAYVKEATLDLCRKIQLSVRVVEQEIFMSASQRARAVERTFSFVCESISVPALFLYSNVRLFQVHFQTTLNYWFFIHHASSHWQNCFTHKSRGNWRNYWGLKKIIFQCTFLKSVNAAPSIVSPSCLLKEIGRVFFFSEWLSLGKGTLEFRRRAFVTLLLPLMSFWHCCIAELSFFFYFCHFWNCFCHVCCDIRLTDEHWHQWPMQLPRGHRWELPKSTELEMLRINQHCSVISCCSSCLH